MTTFESDDLLIKSQMLISKFRKQREIALAQQNHQVYFPCKVRKDDNHQNIHQKRYSDYESYPEREKDNVLLKKFMNQNHFTHSVKNDHIRAKNDYLQDLSQNNERYSSSESSIWSASSPKESFIEKVDFGMMTDRKEIEDVITPITTLRAPRAENNLPQFSQPKEFSSVCTQFQIKESSTKNCQEEPLEILHREKLLLLNDDLNCKINEEDKMKAAWEYFQEEKVLEKEICKQTELVDSLAREMEILRVKLEGETRTLEMMNDDKEKYRTRRYCIFNGLSRETQPNTKDRTDEICVDQNFEEQSNIVPITHLQEQNIDSSVFHDVPCVISSFDDDTVRNIVNRIVQKEFSNSEDQIFNIFLSNTKVTKFPEKCTKHKSSDDECVLSDVLSLKDLNIRSPSNNDSKTNTTTMTSSMSLFNNSIKTFERKSPKLRRTLRPAHSADNIHQLNDNSKKKPGKYVRSPSITAEMKRFLSSSSSSSGEYMFNSTIKARK